MNAKFKEWVVKKQDGLSGGYRRAFLVTLKFAQEFMLFVICEFLYQWARDAWVEEEIPAELGDLDKDSREMMAEFQAHFAEELKTTT